MISKADLETLSQREAKPDSPVLSVYLDTDQSREINVERGFEILLKDLLREIRQKLDRDTRKVFDEDGDRVRQFVEECRDLKRGLVISEEKETCDYCGQAVHAVNDFLERAAGRVLEMRGKVEQVRGAAAEKLQKVGNIGALLRF